MATDIKAVRMVTDEDVKMQAQLLQGMLAVPRHDAAAAAFSYLLYMSEEEPDMLRTLLNEQVVKEGFRGISMIKVLERIARTN